MKTFVTPLSKWFETKKIIFASCIFFASEGFNLYSCGEISAGINEIVLPVLPITALTSELIGWIVVTTPFVSLAKTVEFENNIKIIIESILFIICP